MKMDYLILTGDKETGKDVKLSSTDEIRSYFASLEEEDSEDDIIGGEYEYEYVEEQEDIIPKIQSINFHPTRYSSTIYQSVILIQFCS